MHEEHGGCEAFRELLNSNVVDVRSGCIAIITRDRESQCIDDSGKILSYCPYCGAKIISAYNKDKACWNWYHE